MANTLNHQKLRNRTSRKPWCKQHILLLEVLIALALVALCVPPLMRSQFALMRHELTTLRELQLELAARNAYMEVLEQFLKHEKEWEFLQRNTTKCINLDPITIHLDKGRKKNYICTAELMIQEQKDKNHRANYRLLDIDIILSPENRSNRKITYAYQLFTKRRYVGKDEPPPFF